MDQDALHGLWIALLYTLCQDLPPFPIPPASVQVTTLSGLIAGLRSLISTLLESKSSSNQAGIHKAQSPP